MAIMGGGSAGGWAALALLGYPFLPSVAVGALAGLVGTFGEALSPEGAKVFWLQLLPSLSAWWLLG